ncbi:hypothetical protein HanPSC8_Chr17g0786451 [Helianthus annuus]|nr:hypothetical protein HanPSC8_Chr17g0786451 [Helianthus annuus]
MQKKCLFSFLSFPLLETLEHTIIFICSFLFSTKLYFFSFLSFIKLYFFSFLSFPK